jgi:hypothetical protein
MALTYKSVDTMKASRDSASLTNQQKVDHCNAIVQYVPGITHITVDCYTNSTGYQSYSYVQEWADAVHNTGKKVWWRAAFNITQAGAEATLQEIYNSIMEGPSANPNWFATGDIFELQPETNPYIGDLTGNAQSISDWNAWLRSSATAAEAVFSGMGKTVDCRIVSITDGYAKQGTAIMSQATVTAMNNRICYDSYPMDATGVNPLANVSNLLNDIRIIHAAYPTANIILSEIGCNNLHSLTDADQRNQLREAFNALSSLSYVVGINYWVSYNTSGGGGHTQLFQTGSLTQPRAALAILSEFYTKGHCSGRMKVI